MCGRYNLTSPQNIQSRFETTNNLDLRPNYNAAPGQLMPVVTRNSPNKVELMKWGLIPFWAKDPSIGYKMINARAETVAEKPSYRNAFKSRRCLVPSTGFYEWKREGKLKAPYLITVKESEMFSFAGLYETWKDVEGKEIHSFTIITTTPNQAVSDIHDRMPVILKAENEAEWLDLKVKDVAQLQRLLQPYENDLVEVRPVSDLVNNAQNNVPEILTYTVPQYDTFGGPNPK
jgi:putative SOS response-associated peptidase YedK